MQLFMPPNIADAPTVPAPGVRHRWDPLAIRARRHYGPNLRGRSLLKIAGVYTLVDTPTQEQQDSATEVYIGGHIYEVSDAVVLALVDAGFITNLIPTPLVTESLDLLVSEAGDVLVTEGV